MNAKRVFVLLGPLLAAAIAQAGNEAVVAKPGNLNVVATPAVQLPIVKVALPPAITPVPPKTATPVINTVQPKNLSPVEPGKLQPQIVKVEPQPAVKVLPPGKSIAIDRQQPPPINDRVGVIKPGNPDRGPMISPLDDPRTDHKPGPRKTDATGIDRAGLEQTKKNLRNKLDDTGEVDETTSKRLQEKMDQRQEQMRVISNVQKKNSESSSGIISNMK